MFENAQPAPSSGSGKVIGGVIVVVLVLLAVVYFAFLRGASSPSATAGATTAATTKAAATGEKPDPMKDLTILHFNLGRDKATQTMAIWDIQVQNRSRAYGYKNLKYATNYYNAQDALVYHNEGTLSDTVDPGDQHTYTEINDGLYPVGTTRYTIEIKGADPVQE